MKAKNCEAVILDCEITHDLILTVASLCKSDTSSDTP